MRSGAELGAQVGASRNWRCTVAARCARVVNSADSTCPDVDPHDAMLLKVESAESRYDTSQYVASGMPAIIDDRDRRATRLIAIDFTAFFAPETPARLAAPTPAVHYRSSSGPRNAPLGCCMHVARGIRTVEAIQGNEGGEPVHAAQACMLFRLAAFAFFLYYTGNN